MTTAIVLYVAAAALTWALGRRAPRTAAAVAMAPFLVHLAVVAWLSGRSLPADERIEWIPSLGVAIGIRADATTLLLSAMVGFIGLLIVGYSIRYYGDPGRRAKFVAFMLLFTAGMAGIVVSDELFGLFLFWEVTTVASYLLIGFDDEQGSARAAALQAILVTAAGGLAMLGGFVLLAMASGTTTISELVAAPPRGTMVTVALVLVFVGAFTKSAQFPFHFWLPGAMAAPTPASAYLHSATMVKAGIVLLLFLAPGFASDPIWAPVVTTIGLITMVHGAVVALAQTDLKLLLAYGTVSQLGFITALIGLDLTAAAFSVLLAHAAFKAALFLVVGLVDKAGGTRDIRILSGLRSSAPALAVVGGLVAASMAGIPPLLGFVTKEAAFDLLIGGEEWVALTVIAAASVLTVAYTARFWWGAFGTRGAEPTDVGPRPLAMLLPPAILAALSLVLGLFPASLGTAIADATGESFKLVLWPGLKPALGLSAVVIVAGGVLYSALPRFEDRGFLRGPARRLPAASQIYAATIRGLNRVADVVTGLVQNGSLPVYLAVILTTVLAVPAFVWITRWEGDPQLPFANGYAEFALGGVAVAAAIASTRAQRRLAAALLLGVVGYAVAGIYVVFSAPDLALTQLLAETLTVSLFALVLSKLPRRFGDDPRSLSRGVRMTVAGAVGVFISTAAILATSVTPDRSIPDDYVENAVDAGGKNVVNIILTNFRALDTLGEITVLAAAAIGISALVMVRRRAETEHRS